MTLRDLNEGDSAIIVDLSGNNDFVNRLSEMGFTSGTPVFIEKFAPLRDPMEIVIRGYHLTLRRQDAEAVTVIPVQDRGRGRRRRKRHHV